MNPFLAASDVVDFEHPSIRELAAQLRDAGGASGASGYAERCFNWVRDEVQHSSDTDNDVVTCTASDVLRERVGLCYAKSHLLVALLRAGGVPAGFRYQRLATNELGDFCLHGIVSFACDDGTWYRVDPRGGARGAKACFDPPREQLVYPADAPGEYELFDVSAEPLSHVVAALRRHTNVRQLLSELPDSVAPATTVADVAQWEAENSCFWTTGEWKLSRIESRQLRVIVAFSSGRAGAAEVMALRTAVSRFHDQSVAAVKAELGDRPVYVVGVFHEREGSELFRSLRGRGLAVWTEDATHPGFLPVTTGAAALIEDDAEARRVIEEMLRRGVPVVNHRSAAASAS